MKKRFSIAYFMHIPWGWAKQRPHFFAEFLAQNFEIQLFTLESYRKSNLRQEKAPFPHHSLHILPLGHKSALIRAFNHFWINLNWKKSLTKTDIVWITHPKLWPGLRHAINRKTIVIYDCMDNAVEFPREKANHNLAGEMMQAEKEMIQRANLVLFSAGHLRKIILNRYDIPENPGHHVVVNNGILNRLAEKAAHVQERNINKPTMEKVATYVGTISDWFDFPLIMKTLEHFPQLKIKLIGPSEVKIIPHPQLEWMGPVPHEQVWPLLLESDILLMPFVINPLIESVNPVKLYEYIAAGKPALAPRYPESVPFSDFVYLYDNENHWMELMDKFFHNSLSVKGNMADRVQFCAQHTWEEKVQYISGLIRGHLQKKP